MAKIRSSAATGEEGYTGKYLKIQKGKQLKIWLRRQRPGGGEGANHVWERDLSRGNINMKIYPQHDGGAAGRLCAGRAPSKGESSSYEERVL